ncbi:MAG TPA: bifunctional UDP-sugar hydrolase/5'-nucleotidase, partial [bacterium]|nr:bifunctional UDP-sugar hydrolase/5'-nucleotidase [bacterium]
MRKVLLLVSFMIFAFTVTAQEKDRLLTVIFTNDAHGMAWKFDESGNPGIGGLAAQKTLIDKIKAEVQGKGG